MEGDVLALSGAERERLDVLGRLMRGELRQARAAELLGVGVRQVKRLVRGYRREGDASVVSRRRGRPSNNRLDEATVAAIEAALRTRYADFGATLASEKLGEIEGVSVSKETVRQIQIRLGLWRPKRRRVKKIFQVRERRPRFGELIQIDGSPHDWFEGRGPRCALIVFIDDATGRLTHLRFTPAETTKAYLEALEAHVLAHGLPLAFYSDRHGIFRVNAKEAEGGDGFTEFGRVVERLRIELIHATTPQAKGRVERANQTLQDRLIKEMRLAGVSSMDEAQAFADGFRDRWNKRFAVAPRQAEDAHRPWSAANNARSPRRLPSVPARPATRSRRPGREWRCAEPRSPFSTSSTGPCACASRTATSLSRPSRPSRPRSRSKTTKPSTPVSTPSSQETPETREAQPQAPRKGVDNGLARYGAIGSALRQAVIHPHPTPSPLPERGHLNLATEGDISTLP